MGIKWEHLFSKTVRERGFAYYRQGRVYSLSADEGMYTAAVKGSSMYYVNIGADGEYISYMDCTCPHAQEGHSCKHMAAVLYEMEAEGILGEMYYLDDPVFSDDFGMNNQTRTKARNVVYPFRKDQSEGSASEQDDHGSKPAGQEPADDYHYYDMERIADCLTIYDDVYSDARKLLEEGRVKIAYVEEGFGNGRIVYAAQAGRSLDIYGRYLDGSGRESELVLKLSRDKLLLAECTAKGCYTRLTPGYYYGYDDRQKPCAHLTALLILTDRYIKANDPGDATDRNAQTFLERYRNRSTAGRKISTMSAGTGERQKVIKLEPRLEVGEYGELALSFKVGRNKLFVLKGITDLCRQVENRGQLKLGKTETLDFALEIFDDSSQPFYEFLSAALKEESLRDHNSRLITRMNMVPGGEIIKGSMPLYGKRLDDFFELVKDRSIPYIVKHKRGGRTAGEAGICEKLPEICLEASPVTDSSGSFEGVSLTGMIPRMIDGIDAQYYFDAESSTLNRAGSDDLEILDMLRNSRYSDEIDLVIGRRNLSEFCYRILPELRSFARVEINDRETIEKYLSPEAVFSFFLDADNDDVTCDVKVAYGSREYSLPDQDGMTAGRDRDVQRENEIIEVMNGYFPSVDEETGSYICDCDEERIYAVLESGVETLAQFGEVNVTDRFRGLTVRRKPQITVGVKIESDLLNLSISSEGITEEELLELLQSYRKRKRFHRLKSGSFVSTDDSTLEELSDMLEMMQVSPSDFVKGKMQLPLYRALYLDRMLEKNDSLYAKRDRHFKSLVRDFKTVGDSDYEVPEQLQGIMRNYQKFGYRWLRTVTSCGFGGILADDMGLGKTLQVIAVLLADRLERDAEGTGSRDITGDDPDKDAAGESSCAALIVTPASLVYNWREEFTRFAPQLDVCMITGTKAERKKKLESCGANDILITSYDLLKRDIHEYEDKTFRYQVIDEAQSIKNHVTAAAKAVKVINSRSRLALTGTPIENRLSELWSIFDYLMPGFLYSYDRFRRELEHPVSRNKDEVALEKLKRMVEPFILRRLKSDVLRDLPDKIEEVQYVAFEKHQQQLYDGQALRMKSMLESQSDENFMKSRMQILAELTRIRQICCDPAICFQDYSGGSAKREACMELVRSAADGGHKMLIFSQFTSVFELLEADLDREKLSYYKITGSTKKEERIEMVRRFNEDDTPVFLISLKAGGTGLNLTGADIVVHYDPWWNIAAQNQATDRAHRIGQEKTVSVYKLIVKGSIEEKILKLQEDKKALADEILSGETGGLMTMSREDLMELL